MSIENKPGQRRPHGAAKEGVTILGGGGADGVTRLSKHEGGSHEAQVESRVVEHGEFAETKKLTEDEDMAK